MTTDLNEISLEFARICAKAALPIMEVYHSDFTPEQKADRSPVTQADRIAEEVILQALCQHFPGIAVIAEESFSDGHCPEVGDEFILVDPVDGTKEFINQNGEFTVNIGLIRNRQAVAGCVYAPALQRLYIGGAKAYAGDLKPGQPVVISDMNEIRSFGPTKDVSIAVMSRSHRDAETQAFAEAHGITETISAGSSLKFCLVAEGKAHVYPRFGPTMEWDTAAGHAVLNAAGGRVTRPDESDFLYAKLEDNFRNGAFIAWGS